MFEDEKGRDDLAFDPLPECKWVEVTDTEILVHVPYSEQLSRFLRGIPGARWLPADRAWVVPFRAVNAMRKSIPQINALADAVPAPAPNESNQREREDDRRPQPTARTPRRAIYPPSRPLRREYLVPSGLPCHVVTIEAIGDNIAREFRFFGAKSRNWVAQIFASNGRGGWVRSFLDGNRDYSLSNSRGSRGIMVSYLLEQGPIYEINAPQTWSCSDRYFARVMDNTLSRMTEDEVRKCLEK